MHGAHDFLLALTTVLCVAAVTTVLFQKLRQPVVLGYILAGLIVGPHTPIPLVAEAGVVHILSELGVILLMFALGLEFSLRKLMRVGPTAGLTAVIQCSLMIWLGFVVGRAFGWTHRESLFMGAIIAISSTTIIAKAFDEQKVTGKLKELVVGILIVEDLIAILLMATLTAISSGAGLSASELALTVGRLGAFLVGLVVVGLFLIPRAIRYIVRLNRPETTLVTSVGLCFAIALVASHFGYSVALGAFLAGSLVAESGREKPIEKLVQPVRDMFAAVFFVSVGMLLDPKLVAEHWLPVLVLTLAVVMGKVVSVSVGAFLTGNGTRTSIQAGMSLAQIGEFSFIIAALGLSLKATGAFIYPVAVAVSAITTLLTPWLIKASGPVANLVDRQLPRPMQTFASLYGSWLESLRSTQRKHTSGEAVRRMLRLLLVDAALLAAITIGTSLSFRNASRFLERDLGLGPPLPRLLILAGAVVLAGPFCVGIVRTARKLGVTLAEMALPSGERKVDLAAAPRRALVVTLQLACVLVVGVPMVALTQPFLPGFQGALLLLFALLALGFVFWKSATNLQGHVRAGAQVIVEALAAQTAQPRREDTGELPLSGVNALLPGLGEPTPVRVEGSSAAVGKSLAELNLRGITGATVLAIRRGEEGVLVPTAKETLREGDVLALAGTHDAIEAAQQLLATGVTRPSEPAPPKAAATAEQS